MAAVADHLGDNVSAPTHNPTRHQENAHEKGLTTSSGDGSIPEFPSDRKDALDVEKGISPIPTNDKADDPQDPYLVDWDGPNDPENPLNWPGGKKAAHVAVLSALTFLTPLASSFFAPGVPSVMKDFHSTDVSLATFVVSVFLLGFAFGPLVIAPMSEIYGRTIIYNVCNLLFVVFTIACAVAPNMSSLIVFRFFAGSFGVAPITNGAGTIADMYPAAGRGRVMAIWALGPLLGPVIGPIAGGFLAEAKGWRWVFWVLAIFLGAISVVCLLVVRETYAVTLLSRKAQRLRKETGNPKYRSKMDNGLEPRALFIRAIIRPSKLLFLNPICASMALYMSIVYALLYLLFTTYTFVFERTYGFTESNVGLTYIGSGIGMILGLFFLGYFTDPLMKRLAEKHNNGVLKPEYRLPMLMYTSWTIPVGLFIYGWTAHFKIHWIVPIFGTLVFGIGLIACFMCIQTYLVDTFEIHAASAMAANTVLRSIFGATFPLFALQLYDERTGLGLGWGNSVLGFLALALVPIPFVFYFYGERIRTHPKLQVKL